jgi:hypothetical protein
MDWKEWIGKDGFTVEGFERDDRKGRTGKDVMERVD